MSADELKALAGAGTLLGFRKGEPLCEEGERGTSCFIILKGRAEVGRRTGVDGRYRRLTLLRAGNILGQIALVAEVPRTATVLAGCDLVALELSREVFDQLLQANNPLAMRFQQQIAVTGIQQQRRVLKRLEHVAELKAPLERREQRSPQQRSAPEERAPSEHERPSDLETGLEAYLASLGEWGISVEELDQVEVAHPDGLISQRELQARRLLPHR